MEGAGLSDAVVGGWENSAGADRAGARNLPCSCPGRQGARDGREIDGGIAVVIENDPTEWSRDASGIGCFAVGGKNFGACQLGDK